MADRLRPLTMTPDELRLLAGQPLAVRMLYVYLCARMDPATRLVGAGASDPISWGWLRECLLVDPAPGVPPSKPVSVQQVRRMARRLQVAGLIRNHSDEQARRLVIFLPMQPALDPSAQNKADSKPTDQAGRANALDVPDLSGVFVPVSKNADSGQVPEADRELKDIDRLIDARVCDRLKQQPDEPLQVGAFINALAAANVQLVISPTDRQAQAGVPSPQVRAMVLNRCREGVTPCQLAHAIRQAADAQEYRQARGQQAALVTVPYIDRILRRVMAGQTDSPFDQSQMTEQGAAAAAEQAERLLEALSSGS